MLWIPILCAPSSSSSVSYITIAKAGDEIVSASNLYGGTCAMFDAILPDFGIIMRFSTWPTSPTSSSASPQCKRQTRPPAMYRPSVAKGFHLFR
jgi:O-acetylhomoserine/O-acetylserine sulfhydrylase-like pyridoxal-dependent enzyme